MVNSSNPNLPALDLEALHRKYYRWWTIFPIVQWQSHPEIGVKLGPLTVVCWYSNWYSHGWQLTVTWLGGKPWIDTWKKHADRMGD